MEKDKEAIIEILKIFSQRSGGLVALSFPGLGLDPVADFHTIVEIAKLCYAQDPTLDINMFRQFDICFDSTGFFIAALDTMKEKDWALILMGIDPDSGFVPTDGEMMSLIIADSDEKQDVVAMNIKQRAYREYRRSIGSEPELYDITAKNYQNLFGYYKLPWSEFCESMAGENYDVIHRGEVAHVDIAKKQLGPVGMEGLKPPDPKTSSDISVMRQSMTGDARFTERQLAAIELARAVAASEDWGAAFDHILDRFGLNIEEDKAVIIEIAKLYAKPSPVSTAEYFRFYGLDPAVDKPAIIEITKLCAKQDGYKTAKFFKDFGLDPDADKESIIEIARLCAMDEGNGTAEFFKNFGFDPVVDKKIIIELAQLCAQSNAYNSPFRFDNFGFDPATDKSVMIDIAKLCAQRFGLGTALDFENFGFNIENDLAAMIDIAKLCHTQSPDGVESRFSEFGLSFDSVNAFTRALSNVKDKEWALILKSIDPASGFLPYEHEMKSLVFAGTEEEEIIAAMQMKRRAYVDHIYMVTKIELNHYSIGTDNFQNLFGYYKLPWGEFCDAMSGANYDKIHSGKVAPINITEKQLGPVDMKGLQPPEPKTPPDISVARQSMTGDGRFNERQ